MNLRSIPDKTLIETTESLVRQEQELLTTILHHIREISDRRLFSAMGYPSIFEFTVKYLGYPEDQAYRRISAMKVLKEIPELEVKINTGEISLTHIGLAQRLFRQEKKLNNEMTREEKIDVFHQMANQSVRKAEQITRALSSIQEISRPDRSRVLTASSLELKFVASRTLEQKIKNLKGLLAHKYPELTLGELFEKLCDLGLKEWDPGKFAAPRKRRVIGKASQVAVRRGIFRRAKNQCENCGSKFALEVDHIVPRAFGGSSAASNLRLLCRSCNQRAAIDSFGIEKMNTHLNHLPK